MYGPWLKLERAQEHLERLNTDIVRFLEREPYGFNAHLHVGGQTFTARVYEATPTTAWSIAIGECLHNMRSALDHLAWELCIVHSGEGLPGTEFPIFTDAKKFNHRGRKGDPTQGSGLFKIRGIAPEAQTVIERLQPYNAPHVTQDGPVTRFFKSPGMRPLWQLHELSNIDKHRTIHPVGAFVASAPPFDTSHGINNETAYITMPPIAGPQDAMFRWGAPYDDGAPLGSLNYDRARNPDVQVELRLPIQISFSERGGEEPVVSTLRTIRRYIVREVLPPLAEFLA
jgi:hypothetical protein